MNIITLIFCYFIYIAYLCIYHIMCTVYSLYEFVDEKVENKLKSNQIKSNGLQCVNHLRTKHWYPCLLTTLFPPMKKEDWNTCVVICFCFAFHGPCIKLSTKLAPKAMYQWWFASLLLDYVVIPIIVKMYQREDNRNMFASNEPIFCQMMYKMQFDNDNDK